MSGCRPPHGRLLRRAGGQLVRALLLFVSLRQGAAVLGTVAAAVIGAAAFTIGTVLWWARIVEPRLFARRPQAPHSRPPARLADERHLAFAQALAAVAARYLTECEAESSPCPVERQNPDGCGAHSHQPTRQRSRPPGPRPRARSHQP
jgi:hypothetical protein